jgi:hypothetical protein
MTQKTSRQVVEHFVAALIARDLDRQAEVCAPDMVVEYPQSGERIRGWISLSYGRARSRRPSTFMERPLTRRPGGRSGWSARPKFDDLVESRAQPRPGGQGNCENCPTAVTFVT